MPVQKPYFDSRKIAYPTDQLTVKQLRQLYPDDFDKDGGAGGPGCPLDGECQAILAFERRVAYAAFLAAVGEPVRRYEREFERDALVKAYIKCGLATGKHEAKELIRTFEQAAAEQARGWASSRHP
jgi:hypothetical protein